MKSLSALLALAFLAPTLSAAPEVTNHENNSTVRYPVVLLRGTVVPNTGAIFATNDSKPAHHPTHTLTGVVRNNQFKVLAELNQGESLSRMTVLSHNGHQARLNLPGKE